MAFAFEKLQVYQKAIAFADVVCSLTKGFPRGCFFLADQRGYRARCTWGMQGLAHLDRPDVAIIVDVLSFARFGDEPARATEPADG